MIESDSMREILRLKQELLVKLTYTFDALEIDAYLRSMWQDRPFYRD